MMRTSVIVYVLLIIPLILLQPIYAQVGNFEINVPQINEPPKCATYDIKADKAYVPFQIKVFHDFSRVNNISFEQIGSSIPTTNTSPQVMIFESNFIDDYQITTDVNFDSDQLRAVYIEIWSQNNPSFSQVVSFEGLTWCGTFNVKTAEAPKIPTRTELIGEQAERAFEEMPLIKNAINSNTTALSASINWMFIVVVAALAVTTGQFFAYVGRRRKDKKRGTAFDNMIKIGSKYVADFKKEHSEIKKQRINEKKQMERFLDEANIELRSYLVDLRSNQNLPEKASLQSTEIGDVSQNIEEDAENVSILRKVYESTSDDNLSKFLNYFKNKTGKLAKRHQDLLEDERKKRTEPDDDILLIPKVEENLEEQIKEHLAKKPENVLDEEILPIEDANAIIDEFGKERYRNLTDDELRLLYRAFDAKYREDPQPKYSHRLYKISEILNIRAKEKSKGEKKK